MPELLFEILSEEIPARMQVRAGQDLAKAMTSGLEKAGLTVERAQVLTGPRRLTFVADVPLRSPDVSEERKGPRVGSPERALEGFMKAAGLSDISEAEIRTDPKKGDFYVAVMESAGRDTAEILAELIPDVMNDFPWPKSMKSGGSSFRWVRPLRGLLVLLDGAVIDVEVGGITSSNTTVGHRRHGPGPFVVSDFATYQSQLENAGHVVLSHEARKTIIQEKASAICAEKGLELVSDEGLLNEVAGLTECPVVLLGDMNPDFLNLPDEVIRLTLKSHQKTFTVRDPKTGQLAPHYIIVANQVAPDGGAAIKAGNGKVISARLSDAVFFQTEDRKKNLIDYYDQLDTVVFHKKLGTIRDKAERVAALARELAPKVGADPEAAEYAAKLAKCDLVTQTVIEATSLQGQIGRLMYKAEIESSSNNPSLPGSSRQSTAQGAGAAVAALDHRHKGGDDGREWDAEIHASIATAIEDHYKPQGPSDSVPTDPVAVAVALADKLDTLVGFWAIDEKPTGSKDPFALRRAALGVVRIILENGIRENLHHLCQEAIYGLIPKLVGDEFKEIREQVDEISYVSGSPEIKSMYESSPLEEEGPGDMGAYYHSQVLPSLPKFILDRFVVELSERQISKEIVTAAINSDYSAYYSIVDADLVAIVNRVTALQDFLGTEDGENLLAGYKRAANILKAEAKKGDLPSGDANRPDDEHGAALYDALTTASPAIQTALDSEGYAAAMRELAHLRGPIDAFFTHTQIISDDTAVKENNLRLLGMMRDTARQIADFEAIQG